MTAITQSNQLYNTTVRKLLFACMTENHKACIKYGRELVDLAQVWNIPSLNNRLGKVYDYCKVANFGAVECLLTS